jgi:hypothetical protein
MPEHALFKYLLRVWAGYFKRVLAPPDNRHWNTEMAAYRRTLMPDY